MTWFFQNMTWFSPNMTGLYNWTVIFNSRSSALIALALFCLVLVLHSIRLFVLPWLFLWLVLTVFFISCCFTLYCAIDLTSTKVRISFSENQSGPEKLSYAWHYFKGQHVTLKFVTCLENCSWLPSFQPNGWISCAILYFYWLMIYILN